jgi:GNAT superfamily N-acetyltransferase
MLAWIHAGESCPLEYGLRCEIFGLVVTTRAQGRGLGRAMVEAVARWAREHGLPELAVRSNAARTGSHPFYQHLGFTRIKTQHVYRRLLRPPD